MKRSILSAVAILILWGAPMPARADVLDWFLPHSADWKFIQSTGGLRILPPQIIDGKMLLPVLYDASGLSQITCKPSALNSGIVVDKIKVRRSSDVLVIRVSTCLRKDMGSTEGAGHIHYADLSGIPPGTYQVFYGRANDPYTILGQIDIK
jgi:hypothetical protein